MDPNPDAETSCEQMIECTYTYSDWLPCGPDNTQHRDVLSMGPEGCFGGTAVQDQACNGGGGGDCDAVDTCCTINGGIQVIGITCPTGTCPPGTFVLHDVSYDVDQCSCPGC
jgi:hypothetical protein